MFNAMIELFRSLIPVYFTINIFLLYSVKRVWYWRNFPGGPQGFQFFQVYQYFTI